jgi:hypothetical protein
VQVEHGAASLSVDGLAQQGLQFQLVDDQAVHRVEARWPRPS